MLYAEKRIFFSNILIGLAVGIVLGAFLSFPYYLFLYLNGLDFPRLTIYNLMLIFPGITFFFVAILFVFVCVRKGLELSSRYGRKAIAFTIFTYLVGTIMGFISISVV